MTKTNELINKSKEDLDHLLRELKSKLIKLSFDLADNKVKDVSQIKKTRRDIARVMTFLKISKS